MTERNKKIMALARYFQCSYATAAQLYYALRNPR